MRIQIITTKDRGFAWYRNDKITVKGSVFDHSDMYFCDEKLLEYFSGVTEEREFISRLGNSNGAFSIIIENEDFVYAAVDIVRSLPVFYSRVGNSLILSDDVNVIKRELGNNEIDPVAQEEMLRFGFTLGASTLDSRIFQIEAGEYFVFEKGTGQIKTQTYFAHTHKNFKKCDEEALLDELDQLTTRWVKRLIKSCKDRTIVIPLSGGYDSRYIACALKREGYKKVICYSYGIPGSFEHQIASKVAANLQYPIHVIDYSGESWQPLLESSNLSEFCEFAFNHDAIPCIQELLARETLLQSNLIPSDSIIVPGYCGDLQGGSYVPQAVRNNKPSKLTSEGIDRYILRNLLTLRKFPVDPKFEKAILKRINNYTSDFTIIDAESFCSVLEDWFTKHHVAKFVVNTVRTHELYGNEWRLPLWDKELIEWWYRIPLQGRKNSTLFHKFLFERLFTPANVDFKKPKPQGKLNNMALRWLPANLVPLVRSLYTKTIKRVLFGRNEKPKNIGGFDYVAEFIIRDYSTKYNVDDFTNIHGVVGTWCSEKEFKFRELN